MNEVYYHFTIDTLLCLMTLSYLLATQIALSICLDYPVYNFRLHLIKNYHCLIYNSKELELHHLEYNLKTLTSLLIIISMTHYLFMEI